MHDLNESFIFPGHDVGFLVIDIKMTQEYKLIMLFVLC